MNAGKHGKTPFEFDGWDEETNNLINSFVGDFIGSIIDCPKRRIICSLMKVLPEDMEITEDNQDSLPQPYQRPLKSYPEVSEFVRSLNSNHMLIIGPNGGNQWYAQCVNYNGLYTVECAYYELGDSRLFNYYVTCDNGMPLGVDEAQHFMESFVRHQKIPEGFKTTLKFL